MKDLSNTRSKSSEHGIASGGGPSPLSIAQDTYFSFGIELSNKQNKIT